MGKGVLLGAVALLALVGVAMSGGSAHAEPRPSPGPGPAPVPPTQGLTVAQLANVASTDVALHGWHSGRGVVRTFQIAYNATSGVAPIKVDDKWGPETYHAALMSGVASPTPAWFQPK